jgi:hypothetical protein
MSKCRMRHLPCRRPIVAGVVGFDHRKVDVIVDVNVDYLDSQTGWISADITYFKVQITDHPYLRFVFSYEHSSKA